MKKQTITAHFEYNLLHSFPRIVSLELRWDSGGSEPREVAIEGRNA